MRFLPVFMDVTSGPVALVGSGEHAINKLRLLLAAHATVRWYPGHTDVADEILQAAASPGKLEVDFHDPLAANLAGSIAVVSATGDGRDEKMSVRARDAGIPVNVVDRAELSTFVFPAIVDRGDVVVAIGTSGHAPVLARRLRERIEAIVPARIGDLAALMGRYRRRVAGAVHSPRLFWQKVVDGPIGAAVLAGRMVRAEADLVRSIDNGGGRDPHSATGTVFLVGAGPGDPDLLTLRALQVLQDADIVFHDELVTDAVLDRVRRDAKRVFVGKRRGEPGIGQDEINQRLVDAARAGRITAALGCAAEAELPLTFRNEATRLSFVTAHRADEAASVDWSGLSDKATTVVVYMGLASAAAVRDGLVKAGRDPATPAAVLARGTRPDSRAVVGRLDDLPKLAASAGDGPALLVIGEVVAHSAPWRETLEFLSAQVAA